MWRKKGLLREWHVFPFQPFLHSQKKSVTRSRHVPPLWQGLVLQSSMSGGDISEESDLCAWTHQTDFYVRTVTWGVAVGLFWHHRTNSPTHWFRSGRPPSRRRRCTGTRWLCQCRCLRCGTGYSHNHWCLKFKKRGKVKKNGKLRMFFDTSWSVVLCAPYCVWNLTLVTVGAPEALLAFAAELASGLAPAAAVRSTHIWRNVAFSSRCAVGRHSDCAAVNHCRQRGG